ncbi:MAG: cation-transporting P-type ATPase [Bacteroidales bacterium]|nr:cation-transporting P-type ATPase [Bacteroidales bacterium]MDT8432594.1 cation-transporting P-type ATPase [Bacteroidales bacterium]
MDKKQHYSQPLEKIYQIFNSSEDGLDDAQVSKQREKFGSNELESHEKKSIWALPMITIQVIKELRKAWGSVE